MQLEAWYPKIVGGHEFGLGNVQSNYNRWGSIVWEDPLETSFRSRTWVSTTTKRLWEVLNLPSDAVFYQLCYCRSMNGYFVPLEALWIINSRFLRMRVCPTKNEMGQLHPRCVQENRYRLTCRSIRRRGSCLKSELSNNNRVRSLGGRKFR